MICRCSKWQQSTKSLWCWRIQHVLVIPCKWYLLPLSTRKQVMLMAKKDSQIYSTYTFNTFYIHGWKHQEQKNLSFVCFLKFKTQFWIYTIWHTNKRRNKGGGYKFLLSLLRKSKYIKITKRLYYIAIS